MCGHAPSLRHGDDALDRVMDNIFAVINSAHRAVDHAVVGIVRIDQSNVSFIPYAVRATNDIVDDVGVNVIKPVHRLDAGTTLWSQVYIVASFNLQHRVCFKCNL